MKYISPAALFAILVFLYIAVVIPPSATSQKPVPQAVANGQHIFNQSCAACHDTLGTVTKSGPRLKSYYHQHQPHPTDAQVRVVIQQGKGKMPAFNTLSKSQTDDLLAYLKTL